MEIYKGTSAFSGIAIGKILYYHRGEYQIRQSMVDNVKKELDRLDHARTAVKTQIQHMYKNGAPLPKEQELTLKRQLKLLSGGSFQRAVESMITTEKVSAAYAVQTTRDELANVFRKLEDEAVKEQIENIREISELLIGAMGGSHARINLGDEPVILAAEQLSPNELLEMNKSSLLAIVMHQGSIISHVSIMAKSMAVPTLVEVEIQKEWDGHMAIVDGYTGTLYIDPEPELLKEYEIRHRADMEEREELLRLRNQEDITADGKQIKLLANIGNLDDLNTVLYYGATGIGLLRSEFQYLGRENYPRENELFRAYKKVAEDMEGRPVVIRTVDLGADRQAEYMAIPDEVNPMMGNRGIRLCLDRKKMFKAQLRAIYRASAYGNISLMYPMITSEEELDEIREKILLKRAKKRAMHLLEDMDRSEAGLREKLKAGLYPEDLIEAAVTYVKSFGYLNDVRYAENFILARKSTKSKREILALLNRKGICSADIEKAFESCYGESEEVEAVRRILAKKKVDVRTADEREMQKIYGYLGRKGFRYDVVRQVIQNSIENA